MQFRLEEAAIDSSDLQVSRISFLCQEKGSFLNISLLVSYTDVYKRACSMGAVEKPDLHLYGYRY